MRRCGVPLLGVLVWAATAVASEEVRWAPSFDHALEQAGAEHRYVMVDFFTSWCHWCKVLDAKTYRDGRVVAVTDSLVNVKIDAEARPDLARRYGVRAYPTVVFLNPDGSLRRRIQGYKDPNAFVAILQEVLASDSEIYALERQIRGGGADPQARLDLSRVLARRGQLDRAVAELDTLLRERDLPEDRRAEAELDRWVHLVRQERELEAARQALDTWTKKRKSHPRRMEALYFLARARELDGKTKDARKSYEEITRTRPGTWFAERSRERLAALGGRSEPGPKGT